MTIAKRLRIQHISVSLRKESPKFLDQENILCPTRCPKDH